MAIGEQFGHPRGKLGRLMLSFMNLGHSSMAKWGFSQFDVPEDGNVLDIGCGGGLNVKRLLERCPRGHVLGVDISEESVRKSRAVNKKDVGTRCRIVQGSAACLPFKDGVMDLVTAFETVYFWPDVPACFREVHRVVRDSGRFIVVNDVGDPDRHWEEKIPGMTSYTAEEIRKYMEDAGFTDILVAENGNTYCVTGFAAHP